MYKHYGGEGSGLPWEGYYFSAYGIAVKHGFEGTEEEWLLTLRGDRTELRFSAEENELQWKYTEEDEWHTAMNLMQLQTDVEAATLAQAQESAAAAVSAAGHYPYIGDNGNWILWDVDNSEWVDSGVYAKGIVSVYRLSSLSDYETASEAVGDVVKNGIAVIIYQNISYYFSASYEYENEREFIFKDVVLGRSVSDSGVTTREIDIREIGGEISSIRLNATSKSFLDTNEQHYTVPFIPTLDGHPASKKYVDDSIRVSGHMTAENPSGTGSFSMNRAPNTTVGSRSVAVGMDTEASGIASFAEGSRTIASSGCSHAEGNGSTATGQYSHAEGAGTVASGHVSHAEGSSTEARGKMSHAEGSGTLATPDYQHVQGKFNVEDRSGQFADIVGWGPNNSSKKNIEATTVEGDKRMKGDVYVGCNDDSTGGTKLATVAELESAIEALRAELGLT